MENTQHHQTSLLDVLVMKQANYNFLDDFLKKSDSFSFLNQFNPTNLGEFTPIRVGLLSPSVIRRISSSLPQWPFIVNTWKSTIGANGTEVIIETKNNTEQIKKNKEKLQKKIYNLLYSFDYWDSIESKIVELVALEGNAVLMRNKDGKLCVYSLHEHFNVYYQKNNQSYRYAFLSDGKEVSNMTNLRHGVDLWHFRDSAFTTWPIAPSRFDVILSYVLLENDGLKSNIHLFKNGMIGVLLLNFEKEMIQQFREVPDKDGETWITRKLKELKDLFVGVRKSFKIGVIPGLKEIFEPGKTNKDLQFKELLKELTPERIAWGFSMVLADFGSGGATTYNNVLTFNNSLYDRVGRELEKELDVCRNDWVLRFHGIHTNEEMYVQYIPYRDPNKLEEDKEWREDFKNEIITLNEIRTKRGLDLLDGGDVTYSGWIRKQQQNMSNGRPQETFADNKARFLVGGETRKVEVSGSFSLRTSPTIEALHSEEYLGNKKTTGFLYKWQKAITKQIETFLQEFEKQENINESFVVRLPKIETFFAFNVLKKELYKFVRKGFDLFEQDKRIKNNLKNYTDSWAGKYPQSVIDAIEAAVDKYAASLLKGGSLFESVDVYTSELITNIIQENISLGVAGIVGIIKKKLPDLSFRRAELIASTSVTEAIEGTRETLYLEEFPNGTKAWLTTIYDVCSVCLANEKQGRIHIADVFQSGHTRPPAHPRCRCTVVYYPAEY